MVETLEVWLLMSQRDGFLGGFLLGTLVGGVIGGVVGTLLASRQVEEAEEANEATGLNPEPLSVSPRKKKRLFSPGSGSDIETARRSLEDKIAQLNDAIDDVRQQLGGVNGGTVGEAGEQAIARDPHKQN